MKTMKKCIQDISIFMLFMFFMVISAFINSECMNPALQKHRKAFEVQCFLQRIKINLG